jgi:predicted TIM-barrel enzyme
VVEMAAEVLPMVRRAPVLAGVCGRGLHSPTV